MTLKQPLKILFRIAAFVLCSAGLACAQGTATGLSGLFYTGETAAGVRQTSGTDTHWTVGYASVAGAQNSAYQGTTYIVNSTGQGYVTNTTTAGWITTSNAMSAQTGGTANTGGDYLPGNGNSGTNEATYVYTLAFQIQGTTANGNATITGQNISMSLTIAADDQYQVYVNPAGVNGSGVANNPAGVAPGSFTATIAGSGLSAWGNTASATLANYTATGGYTNNSVFVVGTNYLTIVVENTNSITGPSGATDLNPSGVLLYQTSNVITINGHPITGTLPEVGTWLPIAGALGMFGWCYWRRRPEEESVV
jgi:hypothetical protein